MKGRTNPRASSGSRAVLRAVERLSDALSGSLSIKAQASFAKRLAFLIDAGVPIVEALHMLRDQAKGKAHTALLSTVADDTAAGQALSRSFARFPKFFGNFAVQIVRVGESSGTLSASLLHLADELRKREQLRAKVVGALIYPAVLTVATVGITVFLMTYLFPKLLPIFASLDAELPFSTKVVIGMSAFLADWGFLVLLVLVAAAVGIGIALRKSERLRYGRDRLLLSLPLVGNMLRSYHVANASRTLGLLLRSGMRLSEALPVTAETAQNLVYRKHFEEFTHAVVRGERLSSAVLRSGAAFPDLFANLIAVGERTGTLSETLIHLSDLHDGEVDEFARNLSTLIEPLLMVVMGVVVGFIAIAIITPIYGITETLQR